LKNSNKIGIEIENKIHQIELETKFIKQK
jgi:hypothetical protein